jgi:transporter family-2 protein
MSLYGLVGVVAIGGIATALQAHFMGILDKRIGTLESVFITYFGGGLLIGVIMLIQRGGHLGSGGTVVCLHLRDSRACDCRNTRL